MLRFSKRTNAIQTRCTKDRMGVFQLHPKINVSLDEVREAYELRKGGMSIDNYAAFGLNGENVERYLPVVERLEKAFFSKFFGEKYRTFE